MGVSASTYGCPAPPIGAVINPGNVYAAGNYIGSYPVVVGSYPVATGSYSVAAGTDKCCACDAKAHPSTDRTRYSRAIGSYAGVDGGFMAAVASAT